MIENEEQYLITQREAAKFLATITHMKGHKCPTDPMEHLLHAAAGRALISQYDDLNEQLLEYERKNQLPDELMKF